jgi:hypothetical protein
MFVEAPDVIPCQVDVFPPQRRQMPHQFSGDRVSSLAERFQSTFQVDGIPKGDGGDDQVEATGPVVLMFEAAVPHLSQSVEEHRSGQGVPGLPLVEPDLHPTTQPGILEPLEPTFQTRNLCTP